MDSAQNVNETQPVAQQVQTAQPINTNMNPENVIQTNQGGNKKWMWAILVAILVVIAASGGYLYMNQQKQTAKENQEASKAQEKVKALEKEVSALDEGSLEAEFTVVDTDLQSL